MSEAEASKAGVEPAKNGTVNGAATNEWRDWPTENATARSYGLFSAQLRRLVKKHALSPYKAPDLTLRYPPHVCTQIEHVLKRDGIPTDPEADDEDDDTPRLRVSGKKAAESELVAALRLSNEHVREAFKITQAAQKELFDLLKNANKDLAEECKMLREGHRTATEARELALDQRAERDLAIEQARKKDARMDAVMTTAGQGIQMAIAQALETWQDWKKPKHVKAAELLTKLSTRIAKALDLTPEEQAELVSIVVGEEEKPAPAAEPSSGSSSDTAPKTAEPAAAPSPSSTSMGDESRAPAGATGAPSPVAAADASSGAGTDASGTARTSGTAPTAIETPGTAGAGDRDGTAAPERGSAGPETKPRASRRAPSDTPTKKRK